MATRAEEMKATQSKIFWVVFFFFSIRITTFLAGVIPQVPDNTPAR
jgi:hypothetical protein